MPSISPYLENSSRSSSSDSPFGTMTNSRTYFSCSLSDRPDPWFRLMKKHFNKITLSHIPIGTRAPNQTLYLPWSDQHFQRSCTTGYAEAFSVHFFESMGCFRCFSVFNVNDALVVARTSVLHTINLLDFAEFFECLTKILFGVWFVANDEQTCMGNCIRPEKYTKNTANVTLTWHWRLIWTRIWSPISRIIFTASRIHFFCINFFLSTKCATILLFCFVQIVEKQHKIKKRNEITFALGPWMKANK